MVKGEATNLPFRNAIFDLALCELVQPYVNIERCLKEIFRVAKSNGILHGICHGLGYYLMQGIREGKKFNRKAIQRFGVIILYTIVRRIFHLKRYFYETYQTIEQMEKALKNSGWNQLAIKSGGHPIIKSEKYLGLPTFLEFKAKKR